MSLPLLVFSGLLLYIIAWNFWLSLENWSFLTRHPAFVGVATYAAVFRSTFFRLSLLHSFVFSAGVVAIGDLLGLLLAGLLFFLPNTQRSIYLSILLYPLAISMATNALVWQWLFNVPLGLDWVLVRLHLPSIQWLASETSITLSMFLVGMWAYTGLAVLFYLAAFMGVEREIIDAAKIDGARGLKILFRILLPNSMNGFIVATALLFLFSFRMFTLPYILGGSPSNLYLMTLATYIYYNIFTEYFSESSAASMIVVAIAAAIIIPYALLGLKRWVMKV